MLDKAIGQERAALFPDPSDDARLRETELDTLPSDPARAIRALSDYDWRSDEARATYEQLKDLLRQEVLDSQFRGMKQAMQSMQSGSPEAAAAMQAVRDMMADLNEMLAADARGEHTQEDFDQFMAKHGQFFPDQPANLEELVDSLARRAAAMERMLASMTAEQRDELAALMAQTMEDMGLASEMARLNDALRTRRPDLDWTGRTRMRGDQPLGMSDATTALEEMADLEELESTLAQEYPGASLEDVDEEAIRRALGRQAVDDLRQLREVERELERQGYLRRDGGRLELTAKAVRRLGATALRRVFASLSSSTRGDHDVPNAGSAGELTGSSRAWHFGDEQPLDVVRTVSNAILRSGPASAGGGAFGQRSEAAGRRLRSRRDRTPNVSRGLPARRPVVVDDVARHVGYCQVDRARIALAGEHPVPARRAPGHRVFQLRKGSAAHRTRRPRCRDGAGHEPAARVADRRSIPRSPP